MRPQSALVPMALALAVAAASETPSTGRRAPRGQVMLPSGRVLAVEVADTPQLRALGYMFRKKIGDDEGMVFLMESLGFHPFWMKNSKVGLDIVWLDENWKVVHLEKDVPPCSADPCPGYSPMQAALYVLEVRAGLASREGVQIGKSITFTPYTSPPDP